MIDLSVGTSQLHRLLAFTLFAFLMVSASVGAQSGATPSEMTPSDGLSSWPIAPDVQPSIPSRVQIAGTKRSMNASAGPRPTLQQLCFLPGIGWQNVAVPTIGEIGTRQFTSGSVVGSAYLRRAGGEQAGDKGCSSGLLANAAAPGSSEESRAQSSAPIGLRAVNTGMNDGFVAKSLINPVNASTDDRSASGASVMLTGAAIRSASTIASRQEILGLSSMLPAGASRLGTEPTGLNHNAHLSSLELRRMIWNAPDLSTRWKLQRALQSLEQSRRRPSTDSSKTLNSKSDKFSFNGSSEISRLRTDRKKRGNGASRRFRTTETPY